jgi:putative transposase
MEQQTTSQASSSSPIWERLEAFVREQVQRFIQAMLEEEMTELLGRPKSARRTAVDAPPGRRNGDGKPRRVRLTSGTMTGRRPRVRGLRDRLVSRVLPLFQRRTRQVGELLPQLDWHGLAWGDVELALRGLLGEGAPLSAASLARLKARWQLAYDAWKHRRLDALEVVYVWADGLSVKAGIAASNAARLVRIGALTEGQNVVLAVESGQRESKDSWGADSRGAARP